MNANIKQKYLRHLEELISQAEALPVDSKKSYANYPPVNFLKFAEFVHGVFLLLLFWMR